MFYYLNGTITVLDTNLAVVNCGGVGYACHTTNYTLSKLQSESRRSFLPTATSKRTHSTSTAFLRARN